MKHQRGGTLVGFIAGVVVGLASALVVAVYITKVPVPFMNKGQLRSPDQDEAEAQKNRNWDPNAALHGRTPAKPADADTPATPSPAPAATAASAPPGGNATPASAPPAPAPAATTPAPAPAASAPAAAASKDRKPETRPAATASTDPLGDLARARSGAVEEPYNYYVQLGAYRSMEEAQSQRAKLSLSGVEAKISEHDQSGHPIYRVRVGPFNQKEEGEQNKAKLEKSGLATTLVRVTR